MKKRTILILVALIIVVGTFSTIFVFKQSEQKQGLTPKEIWDIQYAKKKERRKVGYSKADKPNEFTNYYKMITTPINKQKGNYPMGYQIQELEKAQTILKAKDKYNNKLQANLNFISRGPGNVGGRTRAVIIDPDDTSHKTWIVGAATGGIWRTTDEGDTWANLSDKFTNLAVNALAISKSNTSIIYAGTGESFPGGTHLFGNGIWKSADKGETWEQLESTATDENFGYINRLIIDPTNENTLLAATETGIWKSVNGGVAWTNVYDSKSGVEDLVENPENFNVLYAAENRRGILRSEDMGETWKNKSEGLGSGSRFEVAVSSVNPNYVFVSKNINSKSSEVFLSKDEGQTWAKFDSDKNFLGGQGEYDNTIEAHPYEATKVFVGGVDLWRLNFNGEEKETAPTVTAAYSENTSFLSFVNFTNMMFPGLSGGLDTTDHIDRVASDWVSVEIRFGKGLKQKAHRFTVPDQATGGVSSEQYTYADYVEVPFQVWDITNNRQLMVSFRDQEKDGQFNLYPRDPNGSSDYGKFGREYLFVNSVEYNPDQPNDKIAQKGHHIYKCLYNIWAVLSDDADWTPDDLPESKIVMIHGTKLLQEGEKYCIGDSYQNNGGDNPYDQGAGQGETAIPGLHPDHHQIKIIPTGAKKFIIVNSNDGGLSISKDKGKTFKMKVNNYVATQFYGVARHPTKNAYIGGTQDNGTWKSKSLEEATDKTKYYFMLGGDGFECLWHAKKPMCLLGSIYNNQIYKTQSGGTYWKNSTKGIKDKDGPFITRLSASKENPDLVFALGNKGVYRSTNFGDSWEMIEITDKWNNRQSITSSHNVEVSLASGKIVWAGAGMGDEFIKMQVSTDAGKSFKSVPQYSEVIMNAYTSGIATHPTDKNTAYVLFSLKSKPKVLRTTDLGQTWEDISGFNTDSASKNGFPDVVVHSLLVMPYNTDILWVGTDIGIFESTDNGQSWHILEANLPQVSVYDMQIVQNQIVIATHGRGIWSVDIQEIDKVPTITNYHKKQEQDTIVLETDLKVAYDSLVVVMNENIILKQVSTTAGEKEIAIGLDKSDNYETYLLGYQKGEEYKSNTVSIEFWKTSVEKNKIEADISIYPNPNSGEFYIDLKEDDTRIDIHSIQGVKVYSKTYKNAGKYKITLNNPKFGNYVVSILTPTQKTIRKIIIN